ncbi:MAG: hypothetical protein ACKVOH_05740 [Chlamydiales bacterium]
MRIFWFVTVLHFFVLVLFYGFHKQPPPRVTPNKIAVRTVSVHEKPLSIMEQQEVKPIIVHNEMQSMNVLEEVKSIEKLETDPSIVIQENVAETLPEIAIVSEIVKPVVTPKQNPAIEQKTKPVATKPKPAVVKKPSASTKRAPNADAQLVALMQESLQQLEHAPKSVSTQPVKKVGKLQCEAISFATAPYEEALAVYLQENICLPENGDLRLSLTLKRDGTISSVKVTASRSAKNRTYVEKEVTLIHFPPFDAHFKGESAHTFSFLLKSY